ncbi:MAG: carbohydrate kinase [Sphingobacteriales bacterium 17-39-43]|uniref:FGGY-family carbohydrate kinase n=1 Tax=Daejeonella sp. TaxID=2805397 RepID=UPI000BD054A0|nr:FGGY family carbohydrate kinase [Daejeonella sp.]OYZ32299.1 MAG: carbohydrate kinase [Sphingobacteriales bacterium 16-39-50]OZA25547.1 MAG: carbohydrate kinase [Sphingobacteriales bacterium 17-39-43]HQT22178.1 FGGY family carbohydrate kinase [Daejeonella sp.]HQT57485.1 FGGY family carbohydrate kinase [Daejeonella sp.]
MQLPVIAIFDIGKTNKKLLLFDEQLKIVFEHADQFPETRDDDGFPCDDLEKLNNFVFESLRKVLSKSQFDLKGLNFTAYGASFVYIDDSGKPLSPLYNYLKPYPEELLEQFYSAYGGKTEFAKETASPVLGSLNSGMQLYRIKYERNDLLKQIRYALHLPQYLSFLISGKSCSDITSIGCHTNLWDFRKNNYHHWLQNEGLIDKLAPILPSDSVIKTNFEGYSFDVGIGLHDSSAALIPYLVNFKEAFLLISTGTWCISLNPFNASPLSTFELESDCLCYLHYEGKPVKASRLFAGNEHELELNRISQYFSKPKSRYEQMNFDSAFLNLLDQEEVYSGNDLASYASDAEAYHRLMIHIIKQQKISSELVIKGSNVKRIFVDGGFSKNSIYMNLLSIVFPEMEVFAASMAQSTAMGAALAIHHSFGNKNIPSDLIELKFYSAK